MAAKLTWLGHSCFLLETGDKRILVDPFLDDSPVAPVKAKDVFADYILVTHGHFDHIGDAARIAARMGAVCVSNFEICEWLGKRGVKHCEAMNTGGEITLPFGKVKSTIAFHSSTLPDGAPGGNPGGFLLTIDETKIYIAGDTALFSDMKLYASGLDVAIVPIGNRFTMGPEDAVEAIKLLSPKRALPCHYNTWPPIEQDAAAWAAAVKKLGGGEPVVLSPGESISW
jgi:L-ascorbate metabolism protein UlaG (beta-lactamase superfamily)